MTSWYKPSSRCGKGGPHHFDLTVLFVCMGNTCRSPMAEAILAKSIEEYKLNWYVDSAGLRDWHAGKPPNERTMRVLKENGLDTDHVGRMITLDDFYNFDYILAMDYGNYCELQVTAHKMTRIPKCKIERLGSYLPSPDDMILDELDEEEEETTKKSGKKGDDKKSDKKGADKKDDKKADDKKKDKKTEEKDKGDKKGGKKGDTKGKKEEVEEEMGEEEFDPFLEKTVEGEVADYRDIPDPYFIRNDDIFREMYLKINECVLLFLQAKCSTCTEEGFMEWE